MSHGFGWRKQRFDFRDFSYANYHRTLQLTRPDTYEIPHFKIIPIKDQNGVGACVAFSGSTIADFYKTQDTGSLVFTSPEFIYDEGRKREGTYPQDSGMEIRTGCKVLQKLGVPLNSVCPWDATNYNNLTLCNSKTVLANARQQRIKTYAACNNVNDILNALSINSPVWLGFPVYENFPMNSANGIVPSPSGGEIGGHAVATYAYDAVYVKFRNSWGQWGDSGDGYLQQSDLDNFFSANMLDAWTIVDLLPAS